MIHTMNKNRQGKSLLMILYTHNTHHEQKQRQGKSILMILYTHDTHHEQKQRQGKSLKRIYSLNIKMNCNFSPINYHS